MHTPVEPGAGGSPEPAATMFADTLNAAVPKHDYFSWTRAIGDYYFRPEFNGKPVRIAFDDDVAEQIGRSIGADVSSFVAAVAKIINPSLSDIFGGADKGDLTAPHYPFLGILAAQVLSASRMGVNKDVDSTSFWRPFETSFARGEPLRPTARQRFAECWRGAQRHYNTKTLGLLMIQEDPANVPLRGKVHINFPLWQVMLREADRAQVRAWLQTHRAGDLQTPAAFLAALLQSADGFNKTLRTTLQEAGRDASVASALAPMFEEIRSEAQAFTGRSQSRREKGRLRLVGLRTLQCFLQQRDDSGRWFDVSNALDMNAVVYGTIDDVTQTWWRGDDRVAFIDGGIDAFVAIRGDVKPGSALLLLFSDDDPRVVESLANMHFLPVAVDQRLSGLRCVKIPVFPERHDSILALFGCTCIGERLLSFGGGLLFRNQYLSTCLPWFRVRRLDVPVFVDGELATIGANGFVDLTQAASGNSHVVSAGSEHVDFKVLDITALGDSETDPTYGIALSRSGVMRTTSIEDFASPATDMLVGADLWEA